MKKILLAGALVTLAVTILVFMSCSKKSTDSGETGGGGAQWTIMDYGAGNNNLDVSNNNTSYIIQDVQDMEKVGSQNGMNIIAMVTSYRTNRAKYYRVEYYPDENPDQLSSAELQDLGSRDMSDPATLKTFLNYCKANYPAQHYLLVIDDHGAGWPGSCSDELNGSGGLLTMIELKNAISQSDIQHLDIVTFHACLMAMVEVGYELRSVATYMTASQFVMPMENVLAADLWLGWLKNNPTSTPYDLAHKIAEFVPQRAEEKQKTAHFAMIDLSQMTSLGAKIGNFGNSLVQESGNYWNEVEDARAQTHTGPYDKPCYTDLREFANKIKSEEHLSQINLIRNGADSIIAAINAAVPYTSVHIEPGDPNTTRGGLNIHIPYQAQDFDSANYVTLQFRQTNWHAFLSTFISSIQQQEPQGRCCYNNNQNCQVSTQAQCAQLAGNWTQGIDCNTACPTATQGRCCYNNNQNCATSTEAECAQVAGNWTQGIDCNTPCQQTGNCPTLCANAAVIQLGTPVTQCQFTGTDSLHWFKVVVTTGTYRFQLGNFQQGADFDLYTLSDCSTALQCYGENQGPEDFQCSITGSGYLILAVHRYEGAGSYTLLVSQIGFAPTSGLPSVNLE